jgi:Flp pilus assembly pilin Flp
MHLKTQRGAGASRTASNGAKMFKQLMADETGSATAEYAVATMAAVGFAGLLVLILRGDEVRGILTDLVRRALTVAD